MGERIPKQLLSMPWRLGRHVLRGLLTAPEIVEDRLAPPSAEHLASSDDGVVYRLGNHALAERPDYDATGLERLRAAVMRQGYAATGPDEPYRPEQEELMALERRQQRFSQISEVHD